MSNDFSLPAKENRSLDHIPGDLGLPLAGKTFSLLSDPLSFARKRYAQYGMVIKGRNIYSTAVAMHGPDAAQFVLQDKKSVFSSQAGWWPNLGKLFPNSLMLQDFAEHKLNRKIMQEAFRRDAMERYFKTMQTFFDQEVAVWMQRETIHVYQVSNNYFYA